MKWSLTRERSCGTTSRRGSGSIFRRVSPLDYLFPEEGGAAGAADNASSADGKALLRLLKLPRLLRLGRLLKFLARFKYAGAMKILKFIFMLILVAHWVGCFFFFLMGIQSSTGRGTWMEENVGLIQPGEDIPGRYVTMLYASFLMLIGEGMDMETDLEKLYGAFVVLVGTIITAVIVGNVSFVVSNQNSMSFQYRAKIDMVTDEMRALRLPSELMDRTLEYYEYLWSRHRTFDPKLKRFTEDLSPTLRMEILIHLNRDCLLNCDFFRDVSNECIMQLLHAFNFAVYLQDDVLAQEGEVSERLVFLTHGHAKVVQSGKLMPISLLKHGDYFGEKSLLTHHNSAVSVVALEHCDTRVLDRENFERICVKFPELKDATLKESEHMDVTEYNQHYKRRLSEGFTAVVGIMKHNNPDGERKKESTVNHERISPPTAAAAAAAATAAVAGGGGGGEGSNSSSNSSLSPSSVTGREGVAGGAADNVAALLSAVSMLSERVNEMAQRQQDTDRAVRSILQKVSKLRPSSALKKKISRSKSVHAAGADGEDERRG